MGTYDVSLLGRASFSPNRVVEAVEGRAFLDVETAPGPSENR